MLGALLDLGVDVGDAQEVMEYYASYFGDISIKVDKIQKLGINSTYIDIKFRY